MPSSAILAERGLKALNSQDYSQAIELFTQALRQTPESPDYYIKRSTAYQRSSNYANALKDAEIAVVLGYKRGKRELISSAQLRRGASLFMKKRYGDAGFCIGEAEKKVAGEKEKNLIGIWKNKIEIQLSKLDDDDPTREITVSEVPDVEVPIPGEQKESVPADRSGEDRALGTTAQPPPAPGVSTPASRIRHEWYQTASQVVLTIFVKGVPRDKATVEITSESVSVAFPLAGGSEWTFDISPLFDKIDPMTSGFSILSTKIEIKLAKANQNRKWSDLEAPEHPLALGTGEALTATAGKPKEALPVYPTSSKRGPKDWDKVAKALTARPREERKGKETATDKEGEDPEGAEYDSDYEGGDPVNHFFKKLYKDADEDTRRAMMKSYVESNGTALSTNWQEVGRAQVETNPPDGMVAKKWDK
ncbi:SGS-domain-containing protein [Tuber magnatum]|uniref:SGS-domain-containing protein n=1 Tax=Tuber magnatum TaxID=42249 RepID=A0A317SCS9_9PEZI|nr:SGS-domain-containing protein [Tuber magnatum]